MASLTEAEAKTMVEKLVLLRDAIYTRLEVTSTTIVSLLRDASESAKGDRAYQYVQGVAQIRSRLAAIARIDLISEALDAAMLSYAEVLDEPTDDAVEAFLTVWRHFNSAPHDVNSRGISFGSISFSGATGDGDVVRLTVDEYGEPIEVCPTGGDTWEIRCDADQNTGTDRHREQFVVISSYASPDGLERIGSAIEARLVGLCAKDSIVRNASFSQGTSATTLPSWTFDSGSIGTTSKDTSDYYRSGGPDDTTPASLDLGAQSVTLSQKLTVSGQELDRDVPLVFQMAFKRNGSDTGTLAIHVGAVNESVSVSAQSGWTVLRVTLGTKCWALNQTEDELDIKIVWTRTGGTGLLIDDVIVAPMTRIRGHHWAALGGATPWMLEDTASATDSISTEATIQETLAARYGEATGKTLASDAAAGEDWADP